LPTSASSWSISTASATAAGGGFVHRWTRVDDLALSARANRVDFTEDATGVTPYTYVELSGLWTRRLTRRVDGRMRVSAAHFRADDDTARRLIYNATLGTNIRATRRLTVDANAGVAVIDQRTGDLSAQASTSPTDRPASSGISAWSSRHGATPP
jgi:hypothetical protein